MLSFKIIGLRVTKIFNGFGIHFSYKPVYPNLRIADYSNTCISGVQEKDSHSYVNAHFCLIGYIFNLLANVIFLIGCFIISINSSVASLTSTGQATDK